jgi:hypothetical protein
LQHLQHIHVMIHGNRSLQGLLRLGLQRLLGFVKLAGASSDTAIKLAVNWQGHCPCRIVILR